MLKLLLSSIRFFVLVTIAASVLYVTNANPVGDILTNDSIIGGNKITLQHANGMVEIDSVLGNPEIDLKGLYWGVCPDRPVVKNLSTESFLGLWYVHSNFGGFSILEQFKCQRMNIGFSRNKISLDYKGKLPVVPIEFGFKADGVYQSWMDKAKITLNYTLPIFRREVSVPYWILATDYVNWAIVWTCFDYKLLNLQTVAVLTRQKMLNHADPNDIITLFKIKATLESYGLKSNDFTNIDQYNCY